MRRKTSLAAGLMLAALLCLLFLVACETPIPPTISPIPTPTFPDSPLPSPILLPVNKTPIYEIPDENDKFRPMFHSSSHALVNWSVNLTIASSVHPYRLRLVRQLRRVDSGAVLFEEMVVTGILSSSQEPEPGKELAAAWEYDLDLEAEYGVTEAEEWIKPIWACEKEPGDDEPCLCQIAEGDELTDCTELVGSCEGWEEYPEQAADGFCFTNQYSDLPRLYPVYLPQVIVEIATEP